MKSEKSKMEALEGISQAFFPDSGAWEKLKRALKTSIDEDKFDLLLKNLGSTGFTKKDSQKKS